MSSSVTGVKCKQPNALTLVPLGSPDKAIFHEAEALRHGRPGALTLASHPGLAVVKRYEAERTYNEWRYIESGVGTNQYAVTVVWKGNFLELTNQRSDSEDLVLDISFWKFQEGNTVNFVGGGPCKCNSSPCLAFGRPVALLNDQCGIF